MKFVYVVTMYRFGDREKHSYVLGVYSTEEKANKAGMEEELHRGGKYKQECLGLKIDDANEKYFKVITPLEKSYE